ncbi:hypothetical protein ACHAWF_011587 [Thalassiosira exigua]
MEAAASTQKRSNAVAAPLIIMADRTTSTAASKRTRRVRDLCLAALAVPCLGPAAGCAAFAPPRARGRGNDAMAGGARRARAPLQYASSSRSSSRPGRSGGKSTGGGGNGGNNDNDNRKRTKSSPKYKTIGDMMKAMEKRPTEFRTAEGRELNANGRWVDVKKKPRRTRKRVERPKQKYVYASQRRTMEPEGRGGDGKGDGGEGRDAVETGEEGAEAPTVAPPSSPRRREQRERMEFARSLGLNPASQAADAVAGDGEEDVPRILGSLRVDGASGDEAATSNSFAYVMYKPAGWGIVGEKKKKGGKRRKDSDAAAAGEGAPSVAADARPRERAPGAADERKRVKAYDEQLDDFAFVEYSEADVLAAMTPDERAELANEGGLDLDDEFAELARGALERAEWDDGGFDVDSYDDGLIKKKKEKKKKKSNNDGGVAVASATPREKAILNAESQRPSLANWLKRTKAEEGTPVKGGKNWAAVAGATEVDDSGLVLLCPRDRLDAIHVDGCSYLAVVGNARKLASRSKLSKPARGANPVAGEAFDESAARIEVLSRLRTGRDADPAQTVRLDLPGGTSTCAAATLLCQDRLGDGVRGDPLSDPLDRRASRRLVHCASLAATSLTNPEEEPAAIEDCPPPDDVAGYARRRDDAAFRGGSFLGRRSGLARSGTTNAYREVNGAADGHPGWIVDRYDRWLFVQHEEGPTSVRGQLPSLHDGHTAGVYYLPTKADRSIMGSEKLKPTLLEGRAAPEVLPVLENGIAYHVNLGDSFSTGIFLDQRLQRAWLARRCCEGTRVLNCFAHAGAFSVAAAAAGASTVSLDLDRKWLDRIRPQMEANGITEWEGRHDCIYGDCFDWLARLAKRGEQFDVVILDPPSTSVGKKKKRWSVKNDMAELVALAAPLVKSGGLLFTTTNSASLRPEKFAKMCKKGLSDAGVSSARLERVSPMPGDFLSIGT